MNLVALRPQEVSLHITLPFHLVESNIETFNPPEDLEIRRSEWHARIRQTLGSPFETHHGFTARCGTSPQYRALEPVLGQRLSYEGTHAVEELKCESW